MHNFVHTNKILVFIKYWSTMNVVWDIPLSLTGEEFYCWSVALWKCLLCSFYRDLADTSYLEGRDLQQTNSQSSVGEQPRFSLSFKDELWVQVLASCVHVLCVWQISFLMYRYIFWGLSCQLAAISRNVYRSSVFCQCLFARYLMMLVKNIFWMNIYNKRQLKMVTTVNCH